MLLFSNLVERPFYTGFDSELQSCARDNQAFVYLSFSSIVLLLTLYLFRLVGHDVSTEANLHVTIGQIAVDLKPMLRLIGTYAFFFLLTQIIITMLLGIYFLSDRLQFMDDPND